MIVNQREFLEVQKGGIPKMQYESTEYRTWWKEQIRRCKEGYTVGGIWMPGNLYYYINFHHILSTDGAGRKQLILPNLTDLEWELAFIFDECKNMPNVLRNRWDKTVNFIGDGKQYREIGTKGAIICGSRDGGKSYFSAGLAAHEYTFFPQNEIVISSSISNYSRKLLDKIRLGLDSIKGDVNIGFGKNAEVKPPPIVHNRIKKDFYKEVRSGYYKNGVDKIFGYNSTLLHIVYDINDMAANGLRAGFHVFEEAGAWDGGAGLIKCYNSSIPCWKEGIVWFGVPWIQGTGGNMQKGATDLREMFYNPDAYNLLAFDDKYEHRGKIGYFLPAMKSARQFKDAGGITNEKEALTHFLKQREELLQTGKKDVILKNIMYYPIVPSESFLKSSSGIFPTVDLQAQLADVENTQSIRDMERRGTLVFRSGELEWREDNDLISADFPTSTGNKEGCVQIWELPEDNAPQGLYIGGIDPYDQDDSQTNSIASLFIYKRFKVGGGTYSWPVAEYSGRPEHSDDAYEIMRRLIMFFGANIMVENQLRGFIKYMEKKNCLQYLAEQPSILDNIIKDSKVKRPYGMHMTKEIRKELEIYTKNWLIEEYAPGKRNLTKIYSIPLLKELIAYDSEGNFDRVDAFMLAIAHNEDLIINGISDIMVEANDSDWDWDRDLFTR